MYTVRLKSRILPALLLIVTIMYVLEVYRGWYVLVISLGLAVVISRMWSISLARGLSLQREMRFGWAQVGDRLEERFTVKNSGWASALWVEVLYQTNMPDYHPHRITSVGGYGQTSWRTSGICTRRGVYTLGPLEMTSTDPFGFFEVKVLEDISATIVVTPPVIPLPGIEVAPGGRAGDGKFRHYARESTVSTSGVREYQPGDSLRYVHWPSSIKHRSIQDDSSAFFVRVFDALPSSDWWIFLDLQKEHLYGSGFESIEEQSIILAASLVEKGLRDGNAVGLVANADPFHWLPPMQGESQRREIQRALAIISPSNQSLADLLRRSQPVFRENPSILIITGNPEVSWVESLMTLAAGGAAPTIMLFDTVSYGAPLEKDTRGVESVLNKVGIINYRITPQLIDRPEARPGQQGHWDWRGTKSSKAILKRDIGDLSWRQISK